jgi:hypothetical protein
MTREERDRREAEKRARMEGSPDLGGVTLPFSRSTLLKFFWAFAIIFPAWTLWNARQDLTFETTFAGTILYMACLLPSWLWATGRIQGLPIFPIFGLTFLPTYVTPLWQGHSALAKYTPNEINTAAWTVAGFLLIAQLFWQQMAVRAVGVPHAVRMIDLKKAEKILLVCLVAEVVFELLSLFFWQFGGGAFAAIRGFASAAGRMGIFIFCYQIGQGTLKPGLRNLVLVLLVLLVVQETASLLIATVIPTLGIAFAGYILGSGRIPWKTLSFAVMVVAVLHAGKYEMREIYLEKKERTTGLADYPRYFAEWVGYGLKNLGMGKAGEEKKEDVSSAKERGSLIQLLIMIQKETPDKHPYLEGETYRLIPSMLIPRILSPGKAVAHTGNMILSLHYGILDEIGIWTTSVAFDPVMEAYANYGFIGVGILAVLLGFFLGYATRLTINVPMLSFGFLFGVQVISAVVASWNTAGVFVTTAWQSFLALCGLSLFLMAKQNNPVWKYYALKMAEKLKFKKDAKLVKKLEEVKEVLRSEHGGQMAEGGPTSLQTSPTREELRRVEDETAPVKHERPTRFVYGQKQNS